MKRNTFLVVIILSLIFLNLYLLFHFIQMKQEKVIANNNNYYLKNNEKDVLYSYQLNFTTNIINSNLQLNEVTLKDTLNNIIPLKQVFLKGQ